MKTSERLYQHAAKDLGLKELPGSLSQPRIKKAIKLAAEWLDGDDSETAWCGCIMGLWFIELGMTPPKAYYRAANWLNIGKAIKIEFSVRGVLVIFSRSGGNHIAMVDHWDDNYVYCLGGNQANQVSITRYSRSKIEGVRQLS